MNKFLVGFGGFLILLGAGGMINHISMTFKAVEEEREMYGGSVHFMMLQLIGSLGPYLTCLIGGGIIIALAAFINEYRKRSDITSELIQAISPQKQMASNEITSNQVQVQAQPTHQEKKVHSNEFESSLQQQEEERIFWNG